MSIEENLGRIATALEKIASVQYAVAATPATPAPAPAKPADAPPKPVKAAAVKTAAPKAPAPEPAAPAAADESFDFDAADAATPAKLTVDDARKALVALQKAKGSAEASRGVLKGLNLPSLASLKDEQQDLIAKIVAAATALMG